MINQLEMSFSPQDQLKLRDLVTVASKIVHPEETPDAMFFYVAMENIEQETGRIVENLPVQGRKIASAKFEFKKGDVLYGRLRPYLQKVAIASFDGICSTEIIPLRPKSGISAEFLREYLLSTLHLAHVEGLVSGARMPRLRTTDLLDAPVPAFSIPDQQQIGRACTILRVRAYSVEERFRQVLALSGIHREAVLRASDGANEFTRKETGSAELDGGALLAQLLDFRRRDWETEQIALSEKSGRALKGEDWKKKYPIPSPPPIDGLPQLPAGWVWASVEQLTLATSPLCYGVVQPGDESSEGVPMVRVNDLQNDAIRPGKLRRIAFDIDEAHARSRLKGGEVLVSIVGTIGRVAIVPPEMVGANIARAIAKLTVNPLMPSEWIANALMAPRLQFWMQSSSREVARKTLNLESLGKAAIAIPPASMINETLDLQEKHLERVRQTSNNVERTLQRLQYFRRNVVSRIFATNVRIPLFSTEWNAVIASFFESTTAQRTIVAEENKNSKAHRTSGRTSEMNENDLFSILLDHPEGLSPFDLLQRSRYATSTIESFYQELAGEVKKGRISEVRNGIREVKLLVNDDASR